MIECVDVRKSFGDVVVLNGLDLVIDRGEFVALTGASGSGKSTLLHLLAALDRADSGQVTVNRHDLRSLRAPNRYRRTEVGIVFQLHNLLPRLSATENVELALFGSRCSRRERRERAAALLEAVGLADVAHRSPPRLSGGERQRVAIARALVNEPSILLADEPTGSLDRDSADLVMNLLDSIRSERDLTVVMVTHDPAAAPRADREIVLEGGRLRSSPRPLPS